MNPQILRTLIREILKEEAGEVTISRGPRKKSPVKRFTSWVGSFFDADESNADEEILDEDEEYECDE